jgi:hypothetical protein
MEAERNIAHILINLAGSSPTKDLIREKALVAKTSVEGSTVDIETLIEQLEADYQVFRHEATSLVNPKVKPWLKDKKGSIDWQLWQRYVSHLKTKSASFNTEDLDDITDKILDKCADPKSPGPWDRRGMVVGNVQSGKTSNYTGLINKAADAGYKMIIVIAGIHNTLRKQTQERIDEGFIGRNSAQLLKRVKAQSMGVGEYPADVDVYAYTSSDEKGDFNRAAATRLNVPINGSNPTVLVIKKNKSILENLILWLAQFAQKNAEGDHKIYDVPVLVIDDEADSASVNSGTEDDVKTINRYIRVLLNLFDRNAFIGYTATPYANLFIPSSWNRELRTTIGGQSFKIGEDLFPRDFIINIHPPSNYIGATEVFGHGEAGNEDIPDPLPIIRDALDQEPCFPAHITRENKDELPEGLPASLKRAIQSFILTCAIRRLRGQADKHNSMLVHVALRVAWIDRIARLVNETLHDYRNQIQLNAGPLFRDLEQLFEEDFADTTMTVLGNLKYSDPAIKPATWAAVKAELATAISKVQVRAVHGQRRLQDLEYKSIEELNYEEYEGTGLSVIAVGGNKLARGLTLEGLSVSYYLRTTRMYDSLMQMGRWFGYRPGYVDLCRLYTTPELQLWYEHVAMATDEMRADFDVMASQNKTPEQFQIKVMKHPGMLMITSAARMKGHETLELSYSGQLKQTYAFSDRRGDIEANYAALQALLNRFHEPVKATGNTVLWEKVPAKHILDFLSTYNGLSFFPCETMRGYILQQNAADLLTEWHVGMVLNSQKYHDSDVRFRVDESREVRSHEFSFIGGVVSGGLPARSLDDKGDILKVAGDKNAILDKHARTIDREIFNLAGSVTEKELRRLRSDALIPLLVILPIDQRVSAQGHSVPLVGVGVQFPDIPGEVAYEYAVRPMAGMEEEVQESDDPADLDD